MPTDDEARCAEAARIQRIDDAFRRGDLEALRAAVSDPAAVPNGQMPLAIGTCLVYAIYHSPLTFVRRLLELGADPDGAGNDGFPPLIAALTTGRDEPGATRRADVDQLLRLLLSFGADPNQRGVNDWTPLHVAVVESDALAVQRLLEAGADPGLRTRIDDLETPLDMAKSAGMTVIADMLSRRGVPLMRRLRSGLLLLEDVPGTGDRVRRQHRYRIRLRVWLPDDVPVRWKATWGSVGDARLEDDGATRVTAVRIDRGALVPGLFYGVEGMHVGGMRRLAIAPHLGYGARGVPDVIPPGVSLVAELTVLDVLTPV